jgi:hypothetical protein
MIYLLLAKTLISVLRKSSAIVIASEINNIKD